MIDSEKREGHQVTVNIKITINTVSHNSRDDKSGTFKFKMHLHSLTGFTISIKKRLTKLICIKKNH